jgi:hypothetical protein
VVSRCINQSNTTMPDASLVLNLQLYMLNHHLYSSFTSESVSLPRRVSRDSTLKGFPVRKVFTSFFPHTSSPLASVLHYQQQDIPVS